MMRTIEVFLVIIIITGAFIIASFYAVLPIPRRVSPMNLKRLALTTLEVLDADYNLSATVFTPREDQSWAMLQVALSALLPPNIVYNLTVYDVQSGSEGTIYVPYKSISNAESLGIKSEATSYLVASSNVTFRVIPEKVGERSGGITLYILNCSDANGWWITGYTAYSLAEDLYRLLSPYFVKTVMVQNTEQFAQILNNNTLQGERVQNAVVINTFGESVPIPSMYCTTPYSLNNYARYCHFLGNMTRLYNWTWVSIVGWPLYYVSNVEEFPEDQNTYGIYGMIKVASYGLTAFLQGLDNQPYSYSASQTGSPGDVYLTSETLYYCDYYGIYPSSHQTSTRALPDSILNTFHLPSSLVTYIFNKEDSWIPGAVFRHVAAGDNKITGSFFALGLTRTPDIRLTVIGLLCAFKPRLYRSEFNATGTSRLAVLQLGQVGGT